MKVSNTHTVLCAVALVTAKTGVSDAFAPHRISSRACRRSNPSSSSFSQKNTSESSSTILRSTLYGNGAPNDRIVQEEYAKWRLKFNKGDFDPVRYENFKANFMAVTVRNNMERKRAIQNGETAPSPIALNEFGDCSADEYRMAMGQQRQNGSGGPRRMASANTRPAAVNNQGLQPSNTVINTSPRNNNNNNNANNYNNANNARRAEGLANASTQLRSVVQQRAGLESELAQMRKLLEEKKKLLAKATEEEQNFQQRLALREEQKRLLTDRLNNGWEDEGGYNNNNNNNNFY